MGSRDDGCLWGGGVKGWWRSRGGGALRGGGGLGWWGPRDGGVKGWVRV